MYAMVTACSLNAGNPLIQLMGETYVRHFGAAPWNETDRTQQKATEHILRLIRRFRATLFADVERGCRDWSLLVTLSDDNPILFGLSQFGARPGDAYISELVWADVAPSMAEMLAAIKAAVNPERIFARLIPTAPEIPLLEEQGFHVNGTYTHHDREWVVLCWHRESTVRLVA